MDIQNHATRPPAPAIAWFDDGCCDVKFLDIWQYARGNFTRPERLERPWQEVRTEGVIGIDGNGALFQKAADSLMRYQFYPAALMKHVADFDLGGSRWMASGDRIVERFHLLKLFGRPVLDVVGLVEVRLARVEHRQVGFSIITTSPHVVEGRWTAVLVWGNNGALLLKLAALTRPSPHVPAFIQKRLHAWQQRLFRAGLTHFKQLAAGS